MIQTQGSSAVLEARQLSLSYGAKPLIENLNLRINSNEIVIILGPSGVGKSSLLRSLAGLQNKQGGEIRLFDEPLTQPHPQAAFVFQQAALLPWLNLERNVAFGLNFKHQPKITKKEIQQRVQKSLAEVGLSHAAKQFPSALSGGMAQRAALARALARDPKLLLLDEPLGALDPTTRQEMQQLLRRTLKTHHAAAVMVTHDIDEALAVGDRIVLLGGLPATLVKQWQIEQSLAINHDKQNALRQEILHAIQSACTPVQSTSTELASDLCEDMVFAA
ncbi:MAG: ATP-binding cassette domain-containing protein [Alcaligenaceae bacterium]|jgi:NitT/TauT family transport system ATP-binding protein|nr:ATP-binding cassette domain-containing protein [Alcaligenaceae bacterium]